MNLSHFVALLHELLLLEFLQHKATGYRYISGQADAKRKGRAAKAKPDAAKSKGSNFRGRGRGTGRGAGNVSGNAVKSKK